MQAKQLALQCTVTLKTQTLCCYQNPTSRSLLVSGNKRDRIETVTQCAEWSQLAVDYFFRYLKYGHKITAVRNKIMLKAPPGE